jgi:hypothetical protein
MGRGGGNFDVTSEILVLSITITIIIIIIIIIRIHDP